MNEYKERLYEIKFYEFINRFCRYSKAPGRVYDFLELLSDMVGADYLMVRSAAKRCILNERHIRPTKGEEIVLYSKLDYGVRKLCRKMNMNTGSYYYTMKKYEEGLINIEPRFNEKETKAIVTMLTQLTNLLQLLV